ncbi:MAG: hypothetical protein NVS2B14_00630 [Chamaesiphon sp.]
MTKTFTEQELEDLATELLDDPGDFAWPGLISMIGDRLEARAKVMSALGHPLADDVNEVARFLHLLQDLTCFGKCDHLIVRCLAKEE